MIDQYFPCARVCERIQRNASRNVLVELVAHLAERGYRRATIRGYVWAVEHFTAWLESQNRSLETVDKNLVRSFLGEHLPDCHCPSPSPVGVYQVRPALNHLLRLLRGRTGGGRSDSPIDTEVQQYRDHLRRICGLSEATCLYRMRYAREFLQGRFGQEALDWDALQPKDIVAFAVGYAERCRRRSAQMAAESLRSFLRYLQFHGRCNAALLAAVPRIAHWRLSHLPPSMTKEQSRAFLGTFDRSTPTGRRDYAMALCQIVLGFRVSEVAGLLLDNINWHSAVVRIEAPKGGRSRELPLVKRVGQAIADYLRRGRPSSPCRNVFIRHRAPRGPVSTAVIHGAIHGALVKVKGCEHWAGTHVLRHTAATDMLREGASLKEIADVLGHRSIETTTIYAKVDLPGLNIVTMPWPEVEP